MFFGEFSRGFIGLDWGSTRLRSYLVSELGQVVAECSSAGGVRHIQNGDFFAALQSVAGAWLADNRPILACGMVGSREGWFEVPYVDAPAGLNELVEGLRHESPDEASLFLVPGIRCRTASGFPDVMRGEETQILGAVTAESSGTGTFVLPGTHSKWVRVDDGCIRDFHTFFTGELLELLAEHSMLRGIIGERAHREDGFARGLSHALSHPGLLHRLFTTRALSLDGDLAADAAWSYLSGLLIAHEVQEAIEVARPDQRVTVIGNPQLTRLYCAALNAFEIEAAVAPDDCAVRGLMRIAESVGNPER